MSGGHPPHRDWLMMTMDHRWYLNPHHFVPNAKFITHSPDSETSVERFDSLPIPPGAVQEICACTAFVILVGRFFLPRRS